MTKKLLSITIIGLSIFMIALPAQAMYYPFATATLSNWDDIIHERFANDPFAKGTQNNPYYFKQAPLDSWQIEEQLKRDYGLTAYAHCSNIYIDPNKDTSDPSYLRLALPSIQSCLENLRANEERQKILYQQNIQKQQEQQVTKQITCADGFAFNGTNCVLPDQICQAKYGGRSFATKFDKATNMVNCDCPSGYEWNSSNTQCIASTVSIKPPVEQSPPKQSYSVPAPVSKPISNNKTDTNVATTQNNAKATYSTSKVSDGQDKEVQKDEGSTKEQQKPSFISRIFTPIKNFFTRIFKFFWH